MKTKPGDVAEVLTLMAEKRRRIEGGAAPDASLCDLDVFFAETDCEYRYLVPKRIPQGKLMVIPGPAKGGKTTLLLQSFVSLVYTGEFWGSQAEPFPFYYLDYENDTAYIKHCVLDPVMAARPGPPTSSPCRTS